MGKQRCQGAQVQDKKPDAKHSENREGGASDDGPRSPHPHDAEGGHRDSQRNHRAHHARVTQDC